MRSRDLIVVVVAAVSVAGCSGGGDSATGSTAGSVSSSVPPSASGAPPAPESSAPRTIAPTTTVAALPTVPIEDTVDPLDDIATYEVAHGLLPVGRDQLTRSSTMPVADAPCGSTFRATDADVVDRFAREITGCEFESADDAEAFAGAWAVWYRDGTPELFGLAPAQAEPLTVGAWAGRSVVSVAAETGDVMRVASLVRQEGRRVYRVVVDHLAPPERAIDVVAEVTALAARQDAFLQSALVDPEQPGAGMEAAGERVLLFGVFPAWADMVTIAGAEPTEDTWSFWVDIDDHPWTVVESAMRAVYVGNAELSINAQRFEAPGDAQRAAAWMALSCTDAPVPVPDAISAVRCAMGDGSMAIVQHGDRLHRVYAGAALPGYGAGAAADALALAIEARLGELDMADGPEPPTRLDPAIDPATQLPFDLLPDLSAPGDIALDYAIDRVSLGRDPASGVIAVDGTYARPVGSILDAGRLSVSFLLGATDADVAVRYPVTATPVEVPADRWAVNEEIRTYIDQGVEQQSFRPIWIRRSGTAVVVVRSDVGESGPTAARLAPLVQPTLDRVDAHLATITSWDVTPADDPAFVAIGRAADLLGMSGGSMYRLVRSVRATGRPVEGSPAGAVADFWVEFREEGTFDVGVAAAGALVGSQRVVQFDTDASAEAFRVATLRGTPELAEPVGVLATVGWLPAADGAHGTFATRSGRWVFVLDDIAFPPDVTSYDVDGNEYPPETTRDVAATWADWVSRLGLGTA